MQCDKESVRGWSSQLLLHIDIFCWYFLAEDALIVFLDPDLLNETSHQYKEKSFSKPDQTCAKVGEDSIYQ